VLCYIYSNLFNFNQIKYISLKAYKIVYLVNIILFDKDELNRKDKSNRQIHSVCHSKIYKSLPIYLFFLKLHHWNALLLAHKSFPHFFE